MPVYYASFASVSE